MQGHARLEELHRGAPVLVERTARSATSSTSSRASCASCAAARSTSAPRRCGALLERLPRVVQDLARELGKRVRVELAGEEVEVDRGGARPPRRLAPAPGAQRARPRARERGGARRRRQGSRRHAAHARLARARAGCSCGSTRTGAASTSRRCAGARSSAGCCVEMVAEDLPAERIREFIFEPGISTKRRGQRHLGPRRRARRGEAPGRGARRHDRRRERARARGTTFLLDLPSMVALQRVLVLQVGGRARRAADPVDRGGALRRGGRGRARGRRRVLHVQGRAAAAGRPRPAARPAPSARERAAAWSCSRRAASSWACSSSAWSTTSKCSCARRPRRCASSSSLGGVAILRDGAPVFLLEIGSLVENFP